MFSDSGQWQEVVALAIAAGAFLYAFQKVFGFPRRKKSTGPNVVLGDRLKKGLARAQRGD